MKSRIISAIAVFILAAGAAPAAEPLGSADAAAAFSRLKGLSGEWESKGAGGSKSHLKYEVVSGGSVVVEHFVDDAMGAEHAMVTVYYLDGGRLLLTHYCMARNQPRMQAEAFDAATGELRFGFLDATGLSSPGAGHMHSAKFRFIDAYHFTSQWQFVEDGKTKFSETFEYARVR